MVVGISADKVGEGEGTYEICDVGVAVLVQF